MITFILATSGLSRVQLSRIVACCDVLFFEQNRFGSKLRPPFQASGIKQSKSMPHKSPNTFASAEKKKKKKKNLFHFIKKKVLRRKRNVAGSVNPVEIEDGKSKGGKGGAAAVAAKLKVPANPEQLGTCMAKNRTDSACLCG